MFEIYRVKGKDFKGGHEDWIRCVHPEDLPATEKALETAIRDKDRFDWEFRIVWPDGEVRSIKAAALIKSDEKGRPKRLIGVNWDITERMRMEEEIRTMAATDPLTGAHNRRKFMELSNAEYARSKRYGHTLAVLMIDLDHFKAVNDTYGHHTGDLVLQQFTRVSIETLRGNDMFGRVGGEEFAALLVETDLSTARQVAERLRAVIAQTPVLNDGQSVSVKVSIGVAELKSDDQSVEDVIRRADKALYEAKRQGRNRVVPASGQ
jgi:diguanylate cyclase (GGDEF)-like protein